MQDTIKLNTSDWSMMHSKRVAPRTGGRRSAATASEAEWRFPFLTDESWVAAEFEATSKVSARRGAASMPGPLDFSCALSAGEAAVTVLRYPSGAMTFHAPVEVMRRATRAAGGARFVIPVRATAGGAAARRGAIATLVKAIVIKVAKATLDKASAYLLPKLAEAIERRAFRRHGLGWLRVTASSLQRDELKPERPSSTERSLLLIHGTFSDAAGGFRHLSDADFFERVKPLYGDRIFAFNHFSLSRSPTDNARDLLSALPNKRFEFDVVTHSRGGLVLRNLVERASTFGPLAQRFQLGRAVLVASPNSGTPLATPERFAQTFGWFANLLEMFPDNPFTTGAAFVSHALVWLARRITGTLPGLHAMDGDGEPIAQLQAPPGPPVDSYSALVANYHPDATVLQRLLDTGVDQFFASANDLVVPTENGWRIDQAGSAYVPASRIGCFGPGGNLSTNDVAHTEFFKRRETAEFIVNALSGKSQPLVPLDPTQSLPDRKLMRSVRSLETAAGSAARVPLAAARIPLPPSTAIRAEADSNVRTSDTFHLIVMPRVQNGRGHDGAEDHSQILAQYGSARALEPFYLRGKHDNSGKRWQTIIAKNEAIKSYVSDGRSPMPEAAELREFGAVLFETLFPGAVRRLYDTARSLQRGERLNVILTSMIPWAAEKPWEFAYDPVRKTSLATEELHFLRNVMTAIPAEIIDDRAPLRILVASSQPVGAGNLSIEDEETVIRRGFEPLRQAGFAEVEVLARATPASLHSYVSTGRFSVVHFIGHGEFRPKEGKGYLLFQDDNGRPYAVDSRSAREILCGRAVRLVFLNACETGRGGQADFNMGVAPALVAGGVPIVVANQYNVLDASATVFAQHFYWSLGQGSTVAEAAREARVAVNYSLSGESIDFAVPVVYARDPTSRLTTPKQVDADKRALLSPVLPHLSRRRIQDHAQRIAVWDTRSQFPMLASALARWNAAQRFYGFDMVDLSLPIDAWHMKNGAAHIEANRVAERLAPQVAALEVELVCAIVDGHMFARVPGKKDRIVDNIYGWFPRPDQAPVMLFSTWQLEIAPKGEATDRLLTNVVVSGLSSYLLQKDLHDGVHRRCPRFYDASRNRSRLESRQRFCPACGRELHRRFPQQAKALDAILSTFP